MKLETAIVYMQSRRPVKHDKHVTFDEFLLATARYGTPPDKDMAQRLLDAEEHFLPTDERTLAQLQNPRWRLYLDDDLAEGNTGEITDGITNWATKSPTPEAMGTVYFRSTLP